MRESVFFFFVLTSVDTVLSGAAHCENVAVVC